MPVQSALARVGVAVQASKGTLGANPTFAHGITDGNVLSVEIDQEPDAITSGTARVAPQAIRTAAKNGAGFTTRAFPRTVGAWLFGALGAKAVTGAGPYTHTLTPGTSLPRLGFWGELDGNRYAVRDCMVDELNLSWEENQALELEVALLGTVLSFPASMTATTDDSFQPYFMPVGGTFQLDTDSATPVSARIKAGSINVKNNVEPVVLSGSIEADDVFPGRQEYETSLTIVPDDLAAFRETVTGSAAGSSIQGTPVYGSLNIAFVQGANSLTIACLRVPFLCDFPDADPDGGSAELELVGTPVLQAAGATAITATLINSQATY